MQPSPFWEADSRWATQEFFFFKLTEFENLLPCSQGPATGPYPESDKSRPYSFILYLKNKF
jgi:hypothetical protein